MLSLPRSMKFGGKPDIFMSLEHFRAWDVGGNLPKDISANHHPGGHL